LTREAQPLPSTEPALRWAFLVAIVGVTVAGIILGEAITTEYDTSIRTFVPPVLFITGIGGILVMRFLLLPSAARKPEVLPQQLASMGYAIAEAPATYGLVAAIMRGEGWVAIPFGALALFGWLIARAFLASLRAATLEDFPRL
jgi:hypothetical protein